MICIHPIFDDSEFLFSDLGGIVPYFYPRIDKGVVLDYPRFVGYGLPEKLSSGFEEWFAKGLKIHKEKKEVDWSAYNKEGCHLAKKLAVYACQRFKVAYCPVGSDETAIIMNPTKKELSKADISPLYGPLEATCDDNITFCFSRPSYGWVQFAILTSSYNQDHVIQCSDVFDPFPDMIDLMNVIANGGMESHTLVIDEEGVFSYLTVHPHGDDSIELIVEKDAYSDDGSYGLRMTNDAYISKHSFLSEFHRCWKDWLKNDYDPRHWNWHDAEDYLEDEIKRAELFFPPNLDIHDIEEFLANS